MPGDRAAVMKKGISTSGFEVANTASIARDQKNKPT